MAVRSAAVRESRNARGNEKLKSVPERSKREEEEDEMSPVARRLQDAKNQPPIEPDATPERRKEFFLDWAARNPMETVDEAKLALLRQFGQAFGRSYIAEVMKKAKVVERKRREEEQLQVRSETLTSMGLPSADAPVTLQRPAAEPLPLSLQLADVFKALDAIGLKGLTKLDDGSWAVKF